MCLRTVFGGFERKRVSNRSYPSHLWGRLTDVICSALVCAWVLVDCWRFVPQGQRSKGHEVESIWFLLEESRCVALQQQKEFRLNQQERDVSLPTQSSGVTDWVISNHLLRLSFSVIVKLFCHMTKHCPHPLITSLCLPNCCPWATWKFLSLQFYLAGSKIFTKLYLPKDVSSKHNKQSYLQILFLLCICMTFCSAFTTVWYFLAYWFC